MSSRACVPKFLVPVLLSLAAAIQAPASDFRQPQPIAPANETPAAVRFDLYQGYFMVVHGSAGRFKNLNFFVDTGSTFPVLDSRVVKRLKLRGEEPANIIILGGKVAGEWVNLPSLEVGPVERSNLDVISADLSFFEQSLPVRIDGIIGLDVLRQSPFVVDYSASVIRFGATPVLPVSVPLRLDNGLAVFDAEIDQKRVRLLLDTGASAMIVFSETTGQAAKMKIDRVRAPEPTGKFESKEVVLHSLQLGAEEFRKKSAFVTRNPQPAQIDFDGLMSPAALGIREIAVNLERGTLGLSR